jgi:hypothetical protein
MDFVFLLEGELRSVFLPHLNSLDQTLPAYSTGFRDKRVPFEINSTLYPEFLRSCPRDVQEVRHC